MNKKSYDKISMWQLSAFFMASPAKTERKYGPMADGFHVVNRSWNPEMAGDVIVGALAFYEFETKEDRIKWEKSLPSEERDVWSPESIKEGTAWCLLGREHFYLLKFYEWGDINGYQPSHWDKKTQSPVRI